MTYVTSLGRPTNRRFVAPWSASSMKSRSAFAGMLVSVRRLFGTCCLDFLDALEQLGRQLVGSLEQHTQLLELHLNRWHCHNNRSRMPQVERSGGGLASSEPPPTVRSPTERRPESASCRCPCRSSPPP